MKANGHNRSPDRARRPHLTEGPHLGTRRWSGIRRPQALVRLTSSHPRGRSRRCRGLASLRGGPASGVVGRAIAAGRTGVHGGRRPGHHDVALDGRRRRAVRRGLVAKADEADPTVGEWVGCRARMASWVARLAGSVGVRASPRRASRALSGASSAVGRGNVEFHHGTTCRPRCCTRGSGKRRAGAPCPGIIRGGRRRCTELR